MPAFLKSLGRRRAAAAASRRPSTIELGRYDLALLPRAQWRLIVDAQPWTILSNLAAAAAMTAFLVIGTGQPDALWWLLAFLLTAAARFLTLWRWGRKIVLGRNPLQARAVLLGGLAASGVMWGVAAALFIPAGDVAVEAMFLVFAAGLCAAAAATLNAVLGASAAFATPFLGALMARLIAEGDADTVAMAIAVGAFAICVYGVARTCSRQTEQTLRLMLANRRLRRSLREERAAKEVARDEAEKSELSRRQAQSAATAKGRFLSIIGHELKTPLHGVIGFANLIEQQTLGPIGQAQYAEYAQEIGRSGAGLLRLIDKILLYARTSSEDGDFHPREVDLENLLGQVRHEALANAARPGRRIDIDVVPADAKGFGDPHLLRHALAELVENADRFSPVEAPVLIECRAWPDGAAALRVSDNGTGVAPDKATAMMQPFTQADDSYARGAEGLGLGLTLVRHIADLHGAEVAIRPNPAGGTVVELSLPAMRDTTADTSMADADPAPNDLVCAALQSPERAAPAA